MHYISLADLRLSANEVVTTVGWQASRGCCHDRCCGRPDGTIVRALESSSYMKLCAIMNWFTGNIGLALARVADGGSNRGTTPRAPKVLSAAHIRHVSCSHSAHRSNRHFASMDKPNVTRSLHSGEL